MSQTERDLAGERWRDRAATISAAITAAEYEHVDTERHLSTMRQKVETLRNGTTLQVAAEKGDNDKPKYSNELARGVEVTRRLAENEPYLEVAQKIEAAENAQRQRRVQIDSLHRDYQMARLTFEAIAIGRRH